MPKQAPLMDMQDKIALYDDTLAQIKSDIRQDRKTRRELRRDIEAIREDINRLHAQRDQLEIEVSELLEKRDLLDS